MYPHVKKALRKTHEDLQNFANPAIVKHLLGVEDVMNESNLRHI